MRRRMWPFKNLESGRVLRTAAVVYLAASIFLMCITAIAYIGVSRSVSNNSETFWAAVLEHGPLFLCGGYIIALGLIALLTWKCRYCRMGPGRRITTALEKLGKGDLGWKITLRRGDELADVADSVTRASESLAERIARLQLQTRQLTEIENYLIDSVDAERVSNPYTLKALRKLKICTSRLSSNMDDFQVSALAAMMPGEYRSPVKPADELEPV